MTDAPLRWGIYARVSSAEQAGPDSTSIDRQLADGRALVAREGGALIDAYVDDKRYKVGSKLVEPSGTRADRPEFCRMLADIRTGRINAVACWHEWRLFRDYEPFTSFIMTLRGRNVTVKLVNGVWVEQFAVFGAWMGREDNRHRTLQTAKGVWGKAYKGFSPTSIPRCYQTVRDDRGRRAGVELRPEYRAWLDDVARLFLTGTSWREMAQAAPPDPLTGRRLSQNGLRVLLANPFLLGDVLPGKRSHDGPRDLVRGAQPAAWNSETVTLIRLEVARRRTLGRSVPHTHALAFSGLLRCGHAGCGAVLTGNAGMIARRRLWPTYGCQREPATHAPNNIGERKVRLALIEIGQGITRANAPALLARFASAAPGDDPHRAVKLQKLRVELAEIDAQLATMPAGRYRQTAEDDRAKCLSKIDALEAAAAPPVPALPPAYLVDALLTFYAGDDLLTRPAATLQADVRRVFGVLYVKNGLIYDAVGVAE